jgi:hypothetical protein
VLSVDRLTCPEEIDYDNPAEEDVDAPGEGENYIDNGDSCATEYLVVTQLKRPFSPAELKGHLGTPLDCWIKKNRSIAVAKVQTILNIFTFLSTLQLMQPR